MKILIEIDCEAEECDNCQFLRYGPGQLDYNECDAFDASIRQDKRCKECMAAQQN